MKDLKRQDRNGTRTSEELRRRYKLNEIEPTKEEVEYLKQFLEVDDALSTSSIRPVQNKVVTKALNAKVNKETGKGLSSNDYTDADKDKLRKVAANAEENVIESISINGVEQEVKDKNVNIVVNGGALSILDAYPIGSIYMSVNSTNPSTLFGGKWEAWGTGRVPVGVDTTQTEFATVEKTGGSKTNTHNHFQTNSFDGANVFMSSSGNPPRSRVVECTRATLGINGTAYTVTREDSTYDETIDITQPYITCYMWKRTE